MIDEEQIAIAAAKLRFNRNRYSYDKSRGTYQMRMKPSVVNKLRGYYDEYLQTCQQNLFPTVEFNEWVIQYAERGWLQCREKIKGK